MSSSYGLKGNLQYEDRKACQRYCNAWGKLSGSKASAYEREHEFEPHKYRHADEALNRWEPDRERMDCKGWQTAMKYLNKERFALGHELRGQKENTRRLEVVKREFIREKKRPQTGRNESEMQAVCPSCFMRMMPSQMILIRRKMICIDHNHAHETAPGAKRKSSSVPTLKKFYKNFMKTLAIWSKVHYTIFIEIDLVAADAEQE